MRTIRLELLRHGPPHNQLLSPLTEYLALCENHPAATVRVALEHAEFTQRLKRLRYEDKPEYRPLNLEDMARCVTSILGSVPGLARELVETANDGDPRFHLRLILSANELALLPFELANSPAGFASAGQHLLMLSESPICITREVRRVGGADGDLDAMPPPKILFAASSAADAVPLEPHLAALRAVIEPWMRYYSASPDGESVEERRKRVDEHLTVLPQATLRDIEDECGKGTYTHIHLLAHGVPLQQGDDRRYGIALHHALDPGAPDVVDGQRLAKALRPPQNDRGTRLTRPYAVTLAVCDSAGVGSVVGAGASIAHALHEEGIPLVIASQLPLSFAGSIIMARELYGGFLSGEDPRTLLVNLRRRLRTQAPDVHDWASIVAYASFPGSFPAQNQRFRIRQARRRLEAAFHHSDRMLENWKKQITEAEKAVMPASFVPPLAEFRKQRERLNHDRLLLQSLLKGGDPDASAYGILASADKRLAQILFDMMPSTTDQDKYREEARDRLTDAQNHYNNAFRKDPSQAWSLVQALSMKAVLSSEKGNESIEPEEWELARILSRRELDSADRQRVVWAHANLMELFLLVPMVAGEVSVNREEAEGLAEEHMKAFARVVDLAWVEIHSTRRQLLRYPWFFAKFNPALIDIAKRAETLANLLPPSRIFS